MLKDQRPPERESVWSVAKEWLPWCLLLIFLLTFIWTAFVAWVEATPSHRPVCNLLQAIKNWTVGRPGNEATNGELKSRNESRETKVWTRKYGSDKPRCLLRIDSRQRCLPANYVRANVEGRSDSPG